MSLGARARVRPAIGRGASSLSPGGCSPLPLGPPSLPSARGAPGVWGGASARGFPASGPGPGGSGVGFSPVFL
eukprot:12490931-Alexandrium_andersonii.AAC.1